MESKEGRKSTAGSGSTAPGRIAKIVSGPATVPGTLLRIATDRDAMSR